MQQIGRALDQAVAGRQRRAKFQESAGPNTPVGEISTEEIRAIFDAVVVAGNELDACDVLVNGRP
jgi:hypothetical protein